MNFDDVLPAFLSVIGFLVITKCPGMMTAIYNLKRKAEDKFDCDLMSNIHPLFLLYTSIYTHQSKSVHILFPELFRKL